MPRYKSPNGTGRVGRDVKRKALQSDEYKNNIKKLADSGVTSKDIQTIYDRCQERKQTKITKNLLVSKLLELLEYFGTRNFGIEESNSSYISKDDVIEMIMRNPRIMTSGIPRLIEKCQIITTKKEGIREANMAIKSNPGIFNKTKETIIKGR